MGAREPSGRALIATSVASSRTIAALPVAVVLAIFTLGLGTGRTAAAQPGTEPSAPTPHASPDAAPAGGAAQLPPVDEARADRDLRRANELWDEALRVIAEGDVQSGLDALRRAIPLFESGRHPESVFLCYFQSAFYSNRIGRLDEAYDLMQSAFEWIPPYEDHARRTVPPGDEAQLEAIETDFATYRAECHALLGEVLRKLGRLDESAEHYLRAIERNESVESIRAIVNRIDLGIVYTDMSRFSDALECFDLASKLAAEVNDEEWSAQQMRIARIMRAQVFENIGEIDRARLAYEELLAADELTPSEKEETLLSLGRVHLLHLDDAARAMTYFERVTTIAERDPSRAQQATLSLHRGYALNELGQNETAREELENAIRLYRDLGETRGLLYGSVFLGRSLRELGHFDEAISWLEDAESRASEAGIHEGRWEALYELGRTRAAGGDRTAGIRDFESAIELIENVRSVAVPTGNRIRFFGDRQDVYDALVDSLLDEHEGDDSTASFDRAYRTLQRARARSLLDRLDRTPLQLEQVRASLVSEREALVEYVATSRGLRAFVVTAGSTRVLTLDDTRESPGPSLANRVEAARRACLGTGGPEDATALRELGAYLLLPVLEVLPREVEHLVIVPDGPLGSLPFAALPTQVNGDRPYLVESYSLSFAPSGSALAALGERATEPSALLLAAFGDPVLPTSGGGADPSASALSMLAARFDLVPLPATRREIGWIADRVDGEARRFLGPDATVDALRRVIADRPRILHLATHTVVDRRTPEASAVLLSASRDGGFDDGVLRVPDIAALSIPAELVTLSSCDSGEGEWVPGEGVLGLARAFLVAGSRSVLCTLWRVDDDASASFMQQVYHHLDHGHSRSEALRLAQLAFLRNDETSSPRFWAPYVVLGEASLPVLEATDSPLARPWIAIGAGLAVAAAVFFASRLARGRRKSRPSPS